MFRQSGSNKATLLALSPPLLFFMEDRSSPELSMRSFQHHHPPGPPICTTSFCPPWRLIEDAKRPAINGKNGIGLEARKRRQKRENERERSRVCFQTNIKESRKTGKRRRLLCGPTQISHWRRLGFGWFDRPPARRQEKPPKYPYIPVYEIQLARE